MATIICVDNRKRERPWQLDPKIATLSTIDAYLALSARGDVLLLHGGQPEGPQDARKGRSLLIEALILACQGPGRAVVFSGGEPLVVRDLIREQLQGAGLTEGEHFLLLSAISNLKEEIDLPALMNLTVQPGWRIDSVRRRTAAPTLLALALLSQATLLGTDTTQLDDATRTLLGGACAEARGAGGDGIGLLSPVAWQEVLGASARDEVRSKIEREWPPQMEKSDAIGALVTAIYETPAAFEVPLIARAFRELDKVLAAKQEVRV